MRPRLTDQTGATASGRQDMEGVQSRQQVGSGRGTAEGPGRRGRWIGREVLVGVPSVPVAAMSDMSEMGSGKRLLGRGCVDRTGWESQQCLNVDLGQHQGVCLLIPTPCLDWQDCGRCEKWQYKDAPLVAVGGGHWSISSA